MCLYGISYQYRLILPINRIGIVSAENFFVSYRISRNFDCISIISAGNFDCIGIGIVLAKIFFVSYRIGRNFLLYRIVLAENFWLYRIGIVSEKIFLYRIGRKFWLYRIGIVSAKILFCIISDPDLYTPRIYV